MDILSGAALFCQKYANQIPNTQVRFFLNSWSFTDSCLIIQSYFPSFFTLLNVHSSPQSWFACGPGRGPFSTSRSWSLMTATSAVPCPPNQTVMNSLRTLDSLTCSSLHASLLAWGLCTPPTSVWKHSSPFTVNAYALYSVKLLCSVGACLPTSVFAHPAPRIDLLYKGDCKGIADSALPSWGWSSLKAERTSDLQRLTEDPQ